MIRLEESQWRALETGHEARADAALAIAEAIAEQAVEEAGQSRDRQLVRDALKRSTAHSRTESQFSRASRVR